MEGIALQNEKLQIVWDDSRGILRSIKLTGDLLGTEYAGNPENTSYPSILETDQWIGDWKLRVWEGKAWSEERTECSGDIRQVRPADNGFEVLYSGRSENPRGIRNVELKQRFWMEDRRLAWEITVKNRQEKRLEIGELSLALLTNTDFTGIFENPEYEGEERWRGVKQRLWHEQRVQQHLSIDGCSSYALLQRPRGDYPALLFQPLDGGFVEAAYQMDDRIGCQWALTFEGPYYLSLYSNAARRCGGWKYETEQQSYSMNGNRSLVLEPGEERSFRFAFTRIESEKEFRDCIYENGQLDILVVPGMTVPVGEEIRMRVRCRDEVKLLPVANHFQIEEERRDGAAVYYRLTFTEPGQKKVKAIHGKGFTTLLFYAIERVDTLLRRRADFIVSRQYYENPEDPFGRNHAFLPYDDALEMIYTESEESWQVGALDEYALPVAMFAAEKNARIPDEREIRILEEYIDTCLYGVLQERDTFYARRGMYYEERTESDCFYGNKWDKKTAESRLRSFNYPLISNIYFSMYKAAKYSGLTRRRTAAEYLELAYRTAMVGYELGANKFNGAPAGATVLELLDALKEERAEWYEALNGKLEAIARINAESTYPFGSELYVDQTPHNQYEAMMKYYGYKDRLEEAYRVTLALRGGLQPEWFLYGNEKRGNVCCWYATPLNSRVLFDGYESQGDPAYVRLGWGGLLSFLTCVRSTGAAHGWFLWWPDRFGFDWRSLDTDMGLYGNRSVGLCVRDFAVRWIGSAVLRRLCRPRYFRGQGLYKTDPAGYGTKDGRY